MCRNFKILCGQGAIVECVSGGHVILVLQNTPNNSHAVSVVVISLLLFCACSTTPEGPTFEDDGVNGNKVVQDPELCAGCKAMNQVRR